MWICPHIHCLPLLLFFIINVVSSNCWSIAIQHVLFLAIHCFPLKLLVNTVFHHVYLSLPVRTAVIPSPLYPLVSTLVIPPPCLLLVSSVVVLPPPPPYPLLVSSCSGTSSPLPPCPLLVSSVVVPPLPPPYPLLVSTIVVLPPPPPPPYPLLVSTIVVPPPPPPPPYTLLVSVGMHL